MSKTTELGLLIKSLYDPKGAKKAKKDIDSLGKSAEKNENVVRKAHASWGKMAAVAGTAGVAVLAAKQAFDMAKEGAQIKNVEKTFDDLSRSVGEFSENVLQDLRNASAGMVSDLDLMAAGNQLFAMGLAESSAEAAKLTKIAVTLGSAMGKDATQSMEEFSLMLANQSIPRLDTFGISAGKVRARINELMAADKSLSRETAFMNAVMEEAETSMEKVGGAVPTDPFTEFSVATENITNELKTMAFEGLFPVVTGINKLITVQKNAGRVVEKQIDKNIEQAESLEDLDFVLRQNIDAYELATSFIGAFTNTDDDVRAGIIATTEAIARESDGYDDFIRRVEDAGLSIDDLNKMIATQRGELTGSEVKDYTTDIYNMAEAFNDAHEAGMADVVMLGYMKEAAGEANEKVSELTDTTGDRFLTALEDGVGPGKDFNRRVWELAAAGGASAEQLATLGGTMGVYTDEAVTAALKSAILWAKIKELSEAYIAGDITAHDMYLSVLDLRRELENIEGDYHAHLQIKVSGLSKVWEAKAALVGNEWVDVPASQIPPDVINPPVEEDFDPLDKNGPQPKAAGGAVTGGAPYLVGEKGPELFVPASGGSIIPAGEFGAGGINITINAMSAEPHAIRESVLDALAQAGIMANQQRRNL